ncbi:hypothetical protein Taro_051539 [Colocasia esculenta]|uniref:Uncharacterized protein n=1 Tax=Colocasia esculenta TaxID=4460 RepID=A0A843XGV4_COLES|nr:hypothetical protein [Colocasia esculenta]
MNRLPHPKHSCEHGFLASAAALRGSWGRRCWRLGSAARPPPSKVIGARRHLGRRHERLLVVAWGLSPDVLFSSPPPVFGSQSTEEAAIVVFGCRGEVDAFPTATARCRSTLCGAYLSGAVLVRAGADAEVVDSFFPCVGGGSVASQSRPGHWQFGVARVVVVGACTICNGRTTVRAVAPVELWRSPWLEAAPQTSAVWLGESVTLVEVSKVMACP